MADPTKGRGRGMALLQALQKTQMGDSSSSTDGSSPTVTPGESQTPTVVSGTSGTTSSLGGRGRLSQMMLSKMSEKPGGPTFGPASDVSPSPPAQVRGKGRGAQFLQNLLQSKSQSPPKPGESVPQSEVSAVTQQLSSTTLSQATSVGKNKFFREVKETPPVVMKGETGTPCEVTANFIYLNFEENNVFEYEVKYEPSQDYKSLRFKLLNEHRDLFKEKTFDGTTLYIPHKLRDDVTELVSTNPFDESKVKVTVIFRRTRRLSEMIHIYNVLFKQIMRDLELVRFGRQHFNEHAAIMIPQHKLEVWPGYVTAVDEYEGGLMLTLDSTHRVLRTESVLTVIQDAVQRNGSQWKQAVTEMLIGCSVMTTYNKKLFRIDRIDDTMSPRSTFEKTEGGEKVQVSYLDYYKKNYGIDIMDLDQPMLISKDTKRMPGSDKPTDFMICLVPELCQMTGLTDNQRSDFRLMKDVATYTRITPNQRHAAFKQYIRNVLGNENAKKRLSGWGLSLAPETIDITARTLPPEALFFGNGAKVPGKPNAEWNNDACRNPVMQAVDIMRWVILYTKRDQNVANDFRDTLMRCSNPMGIKVVKPEFVQLPNDRTEAYVQALKHSITSQLQLVVCICPTARDDRYAAIKKICCADNPVPSQVINARTIMNQNKLRAITQKILLQINCKLGGTLWTISIPFKTAMIVGIDSYHDAGRKKRSVCAFVASYNQTMTHWYSRAVFQEQGQEVVDGLKSCLIESLKHYLRTNGRLPDRIIMFRFVASYNQTMTHWYSHAVFQEQGQEVVDGLKSCLIESLKHYLRTNGRLPDRIIMFRFVASYNQTMTHWYSRAVFQEQGQEVVDGLKSCLIESLKHYLRTNGRLPDRIIMFRFVASYNQTMTHWYSRAVFQEQGQEVVDGLKSCLIESLKHYLRTNGRLPDRIIMFRFVASYNQTMTNWYSRAVFQEQGREVVDGLKLCLIESLKHYLRTNSRLPDRIIMFRFVASYNQTMTHWYSRAVFQEQGQEVVDGLKSCLIESLKHYLRTNGRLPDRIIMFRDGVGDGQLKMIQNFEIPQMQICFKIVDEVYKPNLTYVIVQKRINTRIFLKAGRDFENPPPGTVVDHKITRRDWYDFLICSQKVNQGTVTPTHYIVVHDDSSMTPDQVQRLTYKMCHLYYNWPGTVRVPAPCQYAHKLAYLVGQNMHAQPSEVLSDKLFFL